MCRVEHHLGSKDNQIHPILGYEETLFRKDVDLSVHRAGSRVFSQSSHNCAINSYGMLQANGRGPSPKTGQTVTPRDGPAQIKVSLTLRGKEQTAHAGLNSMVSLHLGARWCIALGMHMRSVSSWGLWQPAIGLSRGRTLGGRLKTVPKKEI